MLSTALKPNTPGAVKCARLFLPDDAEHSSAH
jgi:hypothetical protein